MNKDTDYISAEQAGTLYGLFRERLSRSPDQIAYQSYSPETKDWVGTTWHEVGQHVARWQAALANEDLQPGDRVALNLRNCRDWVFFDQAAMGLGLVVVPLYPDDRPDNVAYILQDADVKCLLLHNTNQWKRLQPSLNDNHRLSRVIIQNRDDDTLDGTAVYLQDWLSTEPGTLRDWDADPHQLASIIYTSGTTGRPKGVMLSHHNMLSVAAGSLQYFDILPDDLFLSFLPLSHTLERTAGYYLPIMAGASVAYSRGIPQLADDIRLVRPTILIAVPRIFERIYTRLQAQLADKGMLSRLLFKANVNIGWAHFHYRQGRQRWRPGFLLLPLLNKLVAAKVLQRMGGRLRLAVSGGAPLPEQASRLFIGLGLNLLQGYGLTETSPVISVNEPDNNVPASVGRAIPGVAVKVGDNDELLARGPGNMLGYWNNHKATAQSIDAEGWLHTGDQARIDDSGHIFITGRIKDILVLSNGEKVPPADIENTIQSDETFEQAMVIGEGESYLSALLVLNSDKWFSLARELELDAMDNASLNNKKLQQYVIQKLRGLLHDFPAYAKIRRVSLTLEPWTIDNGLLTPTMKVKRPKVLEHHKDDIRKMYQS
ncbi:AMP-dependent synthetase/ligase [uncultured Methylophaga sp.]|uniref:AMP-dependent synthetase/ligase n=1 Tax=uncultured Methylophaga sp. TaxID=285271 RepID=UPI00260F33E6|nr:AMP-dependent synthetase/ligase [uncultured Methylophaga sp.]